MECEAGMNITFGGGDCMYTCADGYDLTGSAEIACESTGELSAPLPTCTGINSSHFLYFVSVKTKLLFFFLARKVINISILRLWTTDGAIPQKLLLVGWSHDTN